MCVTIAVLCDGKPLYRTEKNNVEEVLFHQLQTRLNIEKPRAYTKVEFYDMQTRFSSESVSYWLVMLYMYFTVTKLGYRFILE